MASSDGTGMIDATEFRNVMGNLGERFTIPEGVCGDACMHARVSLWVCSGGNDACARRGSERQVPEPRSDAYMHKYIHVYSLIHVVCLAEIIDFAFQYK